MHTKVMFVNPQPHGGWVGMKGQNTKLFFARKRANYPHLQTEVMVAHLPPS